MCTTAKQEVISMSEKIDYLQRDAALGNCEDLVIALSERKIGCTFAIDGQWGSGKSFFLEKVVEKMQNIQSEDTADDRFFIIEYDCWKNNFYQEPIVGILSVFLQKIRSENSFMTEEMQKNMRGMADVIEKRLIEYAGKVMEQKIGINLMQFLVEVKDSKEEREKDAYAFDELYNLKNTLNALRNELEKIANKKTIVFIVDELDRCLPEYAIKVMESVHHIFGDIDNIITIIAIDKNELGNVVKRAYGNIEVDGYLRKIIDFYFILDLGTLSENYMLKYQQYFDKFELTEADQQWLREMIFYIMDEIDIRTQEKLFNRAEIIHNLITKENLEAACLAFEILDVVARYWAENISKSEQNIKDIFEIVKEKNIGKFIKDIYREAQNGQWVELGTKKCQRLNKSNNGRLVWYIENIKVNDKVNTRLPYILTENREKEQKAMNMFDKLVQIIK